MNFLAGLHGSVAAILICSLLLADEAGIPLPVAPGEALLLLIGVLVSSNAFPLWVIAPLAFLAMTAGMLGGYAWGRAAGQSGLQAIARRVGAAAVLEKARVRLRNTSAFGIAAARMLPGVRPYATLVSGAAEVDPRRFLLGALPALVLWEAIWVTLGMVVGLPIAHLLSHFERLILRGGILTVLGLVSWLAVRDVSPARRTGVERLTPRLRALLALAFDTGSVVAVVAGLFAIGRELLEARSSVWLEASVAAIALIGVLIVARRFQTPGERLFETEYWHHPQDEVASSGR